MKRAMFLKRQKFDFFFNFVIIAHSFKTMSLAYSIISRKFLASLIYFKSMRLQKSTIQKSFNEFFLQVFDHTHRLHLVSDSQR